MSRRSSRSGNPQCWKTITTIGPGTEPASERMAFISNAFSPKAFGVHMDSGRSSDSLLAAGETRRHNIGDAHGARSRPSHPFSRDSGPNVASLSEAYSCGYSSGFAPDSLLPPPSGNQSRREDRKFAHRRKWRHLFNLGSVSDYTQRNSVWELLTIVNGRQTIF